jgi:lipoate-protein ligase A
MSYESELSACNVSRLCQDLSWQYALLFYNIDDVIQLLDSRSKRKVVEVPFHVLSEHPMIEDASPRNHFFIDERVLSKMGSDATAVHEIFEPRNTMVVLGRGSKLEDDVFLDHCREDNIPVFRRAGGGGTVVLSPGMIVVSIAGRSSLAFHLREHMNAVNDIIVSVLRSLGVQDAAIRGISDVALGNRKVLGSSLHRRKEIILYQGSLLVNPELHLLNRYLKHPRRQPDYREQRRHLEFVTSLHDAGYTVGVKEIITALRHSFNRESPWPPAEIRGEIRGQGNSG